MNRWNDEMLDKLADRVEEIGDKVEQLSESVSGLLQAFVAEHEENRQFRLQYERDQSDYLAWKKEIDQRFNNLLEEVRASNRRIDRLES